MTKLKYLIQQPDTLAVLASQAFSGWIASQPDRLLLQSHDLTEAGYLISCQIEVTRSYLESNLPKMFHNTLAVETIRKLYTHIDFEEELPKNTLLGRMIETSFNKTLTSLSINSRNWYRDPFIEPLISKSYMLTDLVHLNLSGWGRIGESNIIQILKELHKLKQLSIIACTHNIVQCLSNNCRLLEDLISRHDKRMNEYSIHILLNLPNLKRIYLLNSSLNQEAIKMLFLCDRSIIITVYVREYEPQRDFEESLEQLVTQGHAGTLKNFKYYSNSPFATIEQLNLVIDKFPLIQAMTLYKTSNFIEHVSPLIELQGLRELDLYNFCFYSEHVKQFLEIRGCNLVNLVLYGIMQLDLNALKCVSQMCPNLETLSIHYRYRDHNDSLQPDSPLSKFSITGTQFKKLEYLCIKSEPSSEDPTEEQLFFLLSNCPNIKGIHINIADCEITNNFMIRVLDRNPLIYLHELNMPFDSDITKRFDESIFVGGRSLHDQSCFIDRIIQNCVSPPEISTGGRVIVTGGEYGGYGFTRSDYKMYAGAVRRGHDHFAENLAILPISGATSIAFVVYCVQ